MPANLQFACIASRKGSSSWIAVKLLIRILQSVCKCSPRNTLLIPPTGLWNVGWFLYDNCFIFFEHSIIHILFITIYWQSALGEIRKQRLAEPAAGVGARGGNSGKDAFECLLWSGCGGSRWLQWADCDELRKRTFE